MSIENAITVLTFKTGNMYLQVKNRNHQQNDY